MNWAGISVFLGLVALAAAVGPIGLALLVAAAIWLVLKG
jgi:hypothetical protein